MTDDEFQGLTQEFADSPDLGEWIADEFGPMIVPMFTAVLTRRIEGNPGYTEGMWVHGYVNIRSVVITHPPIRLACGTAFPGVIRTIPVGGVAVRTSETFRMVCEGMVASYEKHGWTRRPHMIQGS